MIALKTRIGISRSNNELNGFLYGKKCKCQNFGCEEKFRYRIQAIRHANEYNKPKPVATEKSRSY